MSEERDQVSPSMTSKSKRQDNHPLSAIRFFKIILAKALEDGKLKLPNIFTRKYGSGLSKPLFLKPPDGTEWKVCWTKHGDEIMLENGWKEFATFYSIRHGHLVFFQYNETSHIEVNIFDMSGLEIDYPLSEDKLEDQINDETVEILEEMPPRQKQYTRMKKSQMFSSPEALNRAKTFRSRNPSFMVIITPAYANNYSLYVPSNFADVYLKNRHGATLVQVQDGRTWTITYGQKKLRSGWKKFALDNNLNVGDICVFELIDRNDLSFKVSISRAAQQQKCPVSKKQFKETK